MYFPKENQFTNHASKRVFEECYINDDFNNVNLNPNEGYLLKVPEMFAANLSQEKAISPRRMVCQPLPHSFTVRIHYMDQLNNDLGISNYISYDFTEQNDLLECLNAMRNQFIITSNGHTYEFKYSFNKINGILILTANDENGAALYFRFECPDFDNYNELWKLFNQTDSPFFIPSNNAFDENACNYALIQQYSNVWDRNNLYVHVSFSSSKRNYLCMTNDFWFKPSKYYYDNVNSNEFYIWFSSDGTHKITPFYSIKILELAFILRQFARL